jgi:DNA-binding IclR family transcriptional regulator
MSDSTLQTVDRALIVLEALAEKPMTAVQIQNQLGLNKSTVHRLLMTLLSRGFVERNNTSGVYTIGLKLVEISSIRLNNIELKTEASPYLRKLTETLKQPSQLATYDNGEAIYIEKINNVHYMRMYSQIGRRIPVHCSAVGKALVMDKSDEEILNILNLIPMKAYTDKTLITPEAVLEEIRTARLRGFAIDNEEHEKGIFCIAVPIYDYRGQIIAAISTAGENNMFLTDDKSEIVKQIKLTANKISHRMGFVNNII